MENKAEIINHLSKEIEINMSSRFSFRNKINFTLYISPFIILGAYLYASKGDVSLFEQIKTIYLILCGIFYLTIGAISSLVEKSILKRNDILRKIMSDVLLKSQLDLTEFKASPKLFWPYLGVYMLLLSIFICSFLAVM